MGMVTPRGTCLAVGLSLDPVVLPEFGLGAVQVLMRVD